MVATPTRSPARRTNSNNIDTTNPYSSSTNLGWRNPRIILQLLSILAISILVIFASIVRQHASFDNNSTTSTNGHIINDPKGLSQHKGHKKRGPSNREIAEIAKLEYQLQSLTSEYTNLSNEIITLTNGDVIVESLDSLIDAAGDTNDNTVGGSDAGGSDNDNAAWNEDGQSKVKHIACTQSQCEQMFELLDLNGYFYARDTFPAKGCFVKRPNDKLSNDGNLYYGTGGDDDSEEIMKEDLPGMLERVWCDDLPVRDTDDDENASVEDEEEDETDDQEVSDEEEDTLDDDYINPNTHPKDRTPKKWWINQGPIFSTDIQLNAIGDDNEDTQNNGSIIPIDLSVNHLQRIKKAGGSPNKENTALSEEFLPIVLSDDIDFRWRSKAKSNARPENIIQTTAYQIVTRLAHDNSGRSTLWNSGKVLTPNGLPDVVHISLQQLGPKVGIGAIIEWYVKIWDSNDVTGGNIATSEVQKFAIGPSQKDWVGKWISHPVDLSSWSNTDASAFWGNNKELNEDGLGPQDVACQNWEKRSQLPIFRVKLPALDAEEDMTEVASALLVVSGLGSFRTSLDGIPLSSSGPLDPPLTDFAQRVSYRGYDVTKFLTGQARKEHVVGISMGSGWWDHRPIAGSFIRLFYFPHGAVTCIAQLHITYKKTGETKVLYPTGYGASGWQVAKGHLRESSLFTGEYIDLQSMSKFQNWDSLPGWKDEVVSNPTNTHSWVKPKNYVSDTTLKSWRHSLHIKSNAKARGPNERGPIMPSHKLAPIGKLIPNEIPPVLPMERIMPEEVYELDEGRWMVDFGKGFSGMVRFEKGLPRPIVPEDGYPRGHTVSTLKPDESFITVVYGDSIELTTGDINIAVVAGMGLHDGGPKHKSKKAGDAEGKGGPCYPKDHIEAGSLLQRDVYILPKSGGGTLQMLANARQSHFTTHAFRFAEICCTKHPPVGMYAMAYRTAFNEWGTFSSSNIRLNGGYELVKNAMNSNMLSVQSDCPHREKIQYGGDILADSPSSLHMYDMSSFYRKVVWDWGDQQWDNGAYAGTSYWLALNDYAGIGTGSGETVWASAPIVMTARHMQHYGDLKLLEQSYDNHVKWLDFLQLHFDKGLLAKGYDEKLQGYTREGSGLGDWLTFRGRDTWLMHQSFYMASARSIAYIAAKLGRKKESALALKLANRVKDRIAGLYQRKDGAFLPPEPGSAWQLSPGPEMSLYSKVVHGKNRCTVLRKYFERKGHTWPGSEENTFVREMSETTKQEMIESGEITKRGQEWSMGWSQWHGFSEGIFAVRYALQTLSDNGFHNLALGKATGFGCGTFEYMLSHNATTHWESWWRSEDLYSHNHPMLGATAEWMVSSVAGVQLHPSTTGGKRVLFWPRFPNSAQDLTYARATQGTRRGDFSIAWRFEDIPEDSLDSGVVKIHIRLFVPPDGEAVFRLPEYSNGEGVRSVIKYATQLSTFDEVKIVSYHECKEQRREKKGFSYNWEFDRDEETWDKVHRKKEIGTPCESFLFHPILDGYSPGGQKLGKGPTGIKWSIPKSIVGTSDNGQEVELGPGLYDVMIDEWQLKPEVKESSSDWRIKSLKNVLDEDVGPYCADEDTFNWDVNDASFLI